VYVLAMTRREFTLSAAFALAARSQSSQDPAGLTLAEASRRLRARTVTPTDLTEACLNRIKTYNPKINAWITVMREQALAQAKVLGDELAAGKVRSPLHGIPIGLKDNIDTAGVRTTAASAVFEDRVPSEDAEVVRRLKAAGAILIGKCNLHEFAQGGTSAISFFGPVRNPWKLERNAGGSSGGSAAAVAMGCCYGALGTDTGGSIRTPASYCGVAGFKPTHGRVSIRGIIPLIWSLDHCGPLARTVEDTAMILQQIAGYDRLDISSADRPVPNYESAIGAPVSRFRLGVPPQFFDNLDDDVSRAVEDALALLNKMTKGSREVLLPSLMDAAAAGGAGMAESYAYHEPYIIRNRGGYQPQTIRILERGAQIKASDYIRSWRELELVRRTVNDMFQDVDLLVTPTRRRTPRTVDAEIKRASSEKPLPPDPENTRPFNAYGLPTISVPCGMSKDGLPIGLQISGPQFGEINVLALAHAYEQATEWHKRLPPLNPDTKVPPLAVSDDGN
jgi:aspartyl-tRNA(Asn)/glutamyl-tRNA(Gln) amidotransferase subunit A